MKKQGREISFQIELVEDSTHNREYSCIGLVPGGTSQYFNSSIVALSKYNIEKENCFYAFLHILQQYSCYMYVCMCVKILQYIKVVNMKRKCTL